jgi:formylmethanofuran dehydrogenase subunit E
MNDKNYKYPTAICKKCGELIYDGKGEVVRGGAWICQKCIDNKQVKEV